MKLEVQIKDNKIFAPLLNKWLVLKPAPAPQSPQLGEHLPYRFETTQEKAPRSAKSPDFAFF